MQVWLIEPRDPLIARDGRPFGPNPGARSRSLPFPLPSTLAGAIRSRAGQDQNGDFDHARLDELLAYQVTGPLLAEIGECGQPCYMAPAPADALLLPYADPAYAERRRLVPLAIRADAQCGWPCGATLLPVGQPNPSPTKPLAPQPRFWHWKPFEEWLQHPSDGPVRLAALGHGGATPEARTHALIDRLRQGAEEGMLFQTAGLEFTRAAAGGGLESARRLVLACATDAPLTAGVSGMAGERRLVQWQTVGAPLPQPPQGLAQEIAASGHCRLVLLTPAAFAAGFLPQWLLAAAQGVTVQVVAAAMGRFQGGSGWDLKKRQPKAARKLAPAGAVYYLKLSGSEAAVTDFVTATWMTCVSDDDQSRRDGFGLCVLGAWSGEIRELEMK